MRICTWNINGIRAGDGRPFFECLERLKPDILGLQETKCHPQQAGLAITQAPGYESFWSTARRKGYSGVATFCRKPPRSVTTGIGIRKYDSEGRIVLTEHDDFQLYNIYFPNGGSGPERHDFKQEFLDRLLEVLKRDLKHKRPTIVMGDFNVAPHEVDVYDPVELSSVSGFLPEERLWFQKFLALGFVDCFRNFYPGKKDAYTWWSNLGGNRIRNRGWRIDHICVSEDLKADVKSCELMPEQMGSDHCPVYIDLI